MPAITGTALLAAVGIGAAAKGVSAWLKNRSATKQRNAADKAKKEALDYLKAKELRAIEAGKAGRKGISVMGDLARHELTWGYGNARNATARGARIGGERLQEGYADALGALGTGRDSAMGHLRAGTDRARDSYMQGALSGQDQYRQIAGMGSIGVMGTDAPGRAAAMFEQGIIPSRQEQFYQQGVDLGRDPGYQHRLKAGEEAIMRRAAATGGRAGGRTLKALQAHGQELASQEYGAAYQRQLGTAQAADTAELRRRQQQIGLGTTADQMIMQQQQELAGRTDRAALTAQGLRAQGLSQLGAAQTRQGEYLAGMEQQLGEGLSELDYNTATKEALLNQQLGTGLSNIATTEGYQTANLFVGEGTNKASSLQSQGTNMAANRLQAEGLGVSLAGMTTPQFQAGTPYAGAGTNIVGDAIGDIGGDIGQMALLKMLGLI